MLIRISLIVAIVAGLAVGALNIFKVQKDITTTRAQRDDWQNKFTTTDASLKKTEKDLAGKTAELTQTQETLKSTTTEKDKALANAAAQTKLATQLTAELGTAKTELNNNRAELASYKDSGLTAAQVGGLSKTLKQTQDALIGSQDENRVIGKKIGKLEYELAKYRGSNFIVFLPSDIKGEIVVSDPKWDFVVLNVGENQGVVQDGEFLVSREGKLVAKVIVRSVEKNRCVANVIPGWKLGEILEGDQVIPAHPAS